MRRLLRLSGLFLVLLLTLAPRWALSQSYTFVDLGTLGYGPTQAYGINNAGQITGNSQVSPGTPRAFRITPVNGVWNPNPGSDSNPYMQLLPVTSNATQSRGRGINASGQVGGSVTSSKGINTAVWSANGSIKALSPNLSYADAINIWGDLAGTVSIRTGSYACLWQNSNGRYTSVSIPTLPGRSGGFAYGVNDSRQVVGLMSNGSQPTVAFLWSAATGTTALPYPAGHSNTYSRANAINNAGVVVGESVKGTANQPVLWENGVATDLLAGNALFTGGMLSGINNASPYSAVGNASRTDGTSTGILWNGTTLIDLATVTSEIPDGTTSMTVHAINDNGFIVGSYSRNNAGRAFVLVPGP